jgi:hypothetical protein
LHASATVFPGSSAVEQPAVNRLVAGSNPARGAKFFKRLAQVAGSKRDENRCVATEWLQTLRGA